MKFATKLYKKKHQVEPICNKNPKPSPKNLKSQEENIFAPKSQELRQKKMKKKWAGAAKLGSPLTKKSKKSIAFQPSTRMFDLRLLFKVLKFFLGKEKKMQKIFFSVDKFIKRYYKSF